MADSDAWRNTSRKNTVSTRPLRIRSENTFPAPTEGSWSASPTSTSRVPGRRARSSAEKSPTSTMLISSTMTASASSGSFSVFWNVSWWVASFQLMPKSRCTVWASMPVSSLMRLAARPVGAASWMPSPMFKSRATMPRTVVVLPVPGPPMSSMTRPASALRSASAASRVQRRTQAELSASHSRLR